MTTRRALIGPHLAQQVRHGVGVGTAARAGAGRGRGRGEQGGVAQRQRGGLRAAHRPQLAVPRRRGRVGRRQVAAPSLLQQARTGGPEAGAQQLAAEGRGHAAGAAAARRAAVHCGEGGGGLVLLHGGDPGHHLEHGGRGGEERGHLRVGGLHLRGGGLRVPGVGLLVGEAADAVEDLPLLLLQHELLQLVLHVALLGGFALGLGRGLAAHRVLQPPVLVQVLEQVLLQSLLLVVQQQLLLQIELLGQEELLGSLKRSFILMFL